MSNYTNSSRKAYGRFNSKSAGLTHSSCTNCGVDIVKSRFTQAGTLRATRSIPLFCFKCRETLTAKEKAKLLKRRREHRFDMLKASNKVIPPSENRFIFNSPFRTQYSEGI